MVERDVELTDAEIIGCIMQVIAETHNENTLLVWEVACKAALKLIEYRKEKLKNGL